MSSLSMKLTTKTILRKYSKYLNIADRQFILLDYISIVVFLDSIKFV